MYQFRARRSSRGGLIPQRGHQVRLTHFAATADIAILRKVVQFTLAAVFQPRVGVPRALGRFIRGLAFLSPVLVDGSCGNFFRPLLGKSSLAIALLDVLVLTFPFF